MAEPLDTTKSSDKKSAKAESGAKASEKPETTVSAKAEAVAPDAKPSASAGKSSSVPSGGSAKPSASQAKTESGGGFNALLVGVVIIAVAAGGVYATRDVWLPEVEPYLAKIPGFGGETANVSNQPSEVEVLSDRVASLERSMAASGGTVDTAMAAMKKEKERVQAELNQALNRIDDLERRLGEVRALASAMTSGTGASVDLAPIMSRIDGLERKDRETSGEVEALVKKIETLPTRSASAGQGVVLAIAQLRDAALAGRPYAAQLEALRTVAGSNTEIIAAASRLKSTADKGLPTLDHLQTRFAKVAGDIVALSRAGDGDWLQQAAAKLSALVSLRRTDGSSGNAVEDAVARIEQSLQDRDAAAAVKTAEALSDSVPANVRALLEPWLLDAKARATAERALDAMHASALAALEG